MQTDWEGGTYTLTMTFSDDYPNKPPKCAFPQGFFHPNIYPSGTVCLSIVDEEKDWKASITIKQLLLGIQDLLDEPNPNSPAQSDAINLWHASKTEYRKRILEQAKKFPPPS